MTEEGCEYCTGGTIDPRQLPHIVIFKDVPHRPNCHLVYYVRGWGFSDHGDIIHVERCHGCHRMLNDDVRPDPDPLKMLAPIPDIIKIAICRWCYRTMLVDKKPVFCNGEYCVSPDFKVITYRRE